jgi:hypothetical protein
MGSPVLAKQAEKILDLCRSADYSSVYLMCICGIITAESNGYIIPDTDKIKIVTVTTFSLPNPSPPKKN